MARGEREIGDKLLPKIMSAVIGSVIATKTGLTGHEYNLRVNAGQELINRMGHEVADLYRPILMPALSDERISPAVRDFLAKATSGEDQWQAVAGLLIGASGATNVLGQIIGNELAPAGYDLVETNPHLIPDIGTIITAVIKRTMSESTGQGNLAKLGYDSGWYDAIVNSAWQYPAPDVAAELYHRGEIDDTTYTNLLERQGIHPDFIQPITDIRGNILTPADAALAVLRNKITLDQGNQIANQNGYTDDDFDILLYNTGEPPGPQELAEAYRRKIIDKDTFTKGILQSRVRDEWVSTLLALRYAPLNTADAVNAYVEGYVDEATVETVADQNGLDPGQYKILIEAAGDPLSYTDMMRLWRYGLATENDVKSALKRGRLKDDYIDFALALKDSPMSVPDAIESSIQGYLSKDNAKTIALMNGLREVDFDPLYLTAGSPLSRTEMTQLWRRGLVTEDEVKDALRQSRLKDSYIDQALDLKVQLPALYETRALLADGGLTATQGTQILLSQGYQDDIVKAIVSNALGQTTDLHKALTEAMYADLYKEAAITADEFIKSLEALGYSQADSLLIQSVYDDQIDLSQRNGVISKVKSAYVAHRIDQGTAEGDLNSLGLPADMVDKLISDWDIIITTDTKMLTQAQVSDAWQMQLFSQGNEVDNTQAALQYLTNLGYSADDAVTILEIKNKGPLTSDQTNPTVSGTPGSATVAGSA
jgi:hypothetical protein